MCVCVGGLLCFGYLVLYQIYILFIYLCTYLYESLNLLAKSTHLTLPPDIHWVGQSKQQPCSFERIIIFGTTLKSPRLSRHCFTLVGSTLATVPLNGANRWCMCAKWCLLSLFALIVSELLKIETRDETERWDLMGEKKTFTIPKENVKSNTNH